MNVRLLKQKAALLILVLLSVAFQPAMADSVSAVVDRLSIYLDETAKLTVTADGQSLMGHQPQLSVLEQNFEILGQSSQTNMRMENGQTHVSQSWVIEIRPRRLGKLTIPPIGVGGLRTDALEIKVAEYLPQIPSSDDDVFINVEIIPENPYVQSQVTIVTRLFYAVDIVRGEIDEPKIPFGKADKLGSDRRYTAQQGGRKYNVAEFRHVTFPQNSGVFEVPPIDFSGIVSSVNNATLQRDHTRIRISSRPVSVNIRPKPQSYSGRTWLPAKNILIHDSWQGAIPEFEAGKPEPRMISIEAVGLKSTHLSSPDYEKSDTVRIYSTNPQMSDGLSDGMAVARRDEEFVIIPNSAGAVEVPAFEVVWWDVDADEEKTAVLPALSNAQALPVAHGDQRLAEGAHGDTNDSAIRNSIAGSDSMWRWVSAGALAIWLVTMILWYASWRRWQRNRMRRQGKREAEDLDAVSLGAKRRQIKKACMENDIGAAGTHLLEWAKIRWKDDSPANLLELANALENQELLAELTAMDENMYSARAENWQGARFWREFSKVSAALESSTPKRFKFLAFGKKPDVLEELWPDSSFDKAR